MSKDVGGLGVVKIGPDGAETSGASMTRSKSTISSLRAAMFLPIFKSWAQHSGDAVDEGIAGIAGIASARADVRLVL